MSFTSIISNMLGTALGKCLVVLTGACLVLGGLLLWERRNSAGLSERIGGNEIVIAGQARALEELRQERARLESALQNREAEHARIREELEHARARLAHDLRHDPASLEWSATPLPQPVRDVLTEEGARFVLPQESTPGREFEAAWTVP